MSGLRQRVVSATPSPPVDCVQGLSAALKQAKEAASASGLSQEELSHCVTELVKTKLKPPTNSLQTTKSKPCFFTCFKIFWTLWVVFAVLIGLAVLYMLYGPKGKVTKE